MKGPGMNVKNEEDSLKAVRNKEFAESEKKWEDDFVAACMSKLLLQLEKDQKKKVAERMPHVIVPNADFYLGLEDKDTNQIHRFVVYRPQAEDVIRAMRKRGVTAKLFDHNKQKW